MIGQRGRMEMQGGKDEEDSNDDTECVAKT